MNGNDREEIRETVEAAVDESVALELIEALGPMIHGAVHRSVVRIARYFVVGFVLLAVASGLLWRDVRQSADTSHAQREEAVELICELNDVGQLLIEDPSAKDRLRNQNCEQLLREVREAQ